MSGPRSYTPCRASSEHPRGLPDRPQPGRMSAHEPVRTDKLSGRLLERLPNTRLLPAHGAHLHTRSVSETCSSPVVRDRLGRAAPMRQLLTSRNAARACNAMILGGFAALWGYVYKHSLTMKPDDTLTPYGHYALAAGNKTIEKPVDER